MAVFDAANYGQMLIDASYYISLVQSALADLQSLSDLGSLASSVDEAAWVASELRKIANDLVGRGSLWAQLSDRGALPTNASAYAQWNVRSSDFGAECFNGVVQAQKLLVGAQKALDALMRTLRLVTMLSGNKAGLQTLNTQVGILAMQASRMDAQTSVFYQAMAGSEMIKSLNEVVSHTLAQNRLDGWGINTMQELGDFTWTAP